MSTYHVTKTKSKLCCRVSAGREYFITPSPLFGKFGTVTINLAGTFAGILLKQLWKHVKKENIRSPKLFILFLKELMLY